MTVNFDRTIFYFTILYNFDDCLIVLDFITMVYIAILILINKNKIYSSIQYKILQKCPQFFWKTTESKFSIPREPILRSRDIVYLYGAIDRRLNVFHWLYID